MCENFNYFLFIIGRAVFDNLDASLARVPTIYVCFAYGSGQAQICDCLKKESYINNGLKRCKEDKNGGKRHSK